MCGVNEEVRWALEAISAQAADHRLATWTLERLSEREIERAAARDALEASLANIYQKESK